jgi:polysaccharide biosynthesis protein PslG
VPAATGEDPGVSDYLLGMSTRQRRTPRARTLAPFAALLAALLALLAGSGDVAGAARAHASAGAPLGGVNIVDLGRGSTSAEADKAISYARQLHAKVVRTELPWAVFEPEAQGRINQSAEDFTDRLMSDAQAAGIRVIANVDSSPCWASSAPASLLSQCSSKTHTAANTYPPSDPATYGNFVAFLARRYVAQLAAIEVWNEPDQSNEFYFGGPNKARNYAALLRGAYPAVKLANPQMPVLGGSIVGTNGVFLKALYAAGIKGYYDGLSVHFYTLTLAALRATHEVQLANGDRTPLWLNEFGWTSCWPKHKIQQDQGCVTQAVQAKNLTNTFRALARTPWVASEVVYKLQDSPLEEFGSITARGAHKPAFSALSHVLASPFAPAGPVTLSLRKRGGQVLAGGEAPVGDFMRLEAFQGKLLRYRATFELDRFNRYSIPLPRVLGSSGLRVRVSQAWTGLARAAQKTI